MIKAPHWPPPLYSGKEIKLGLERMDALLAALGSPHKKLPPVIHVAGTNGKGSLIAYLRAMLTAAGYKVHVYTSPHLVEFNERIVLAGEEITDAAVHEVFEECRLSAEKNNIPVTFFEGNTVGAFLAFSRVKADIVLLEVGLGGRFDATNVIDKPLLTAITPISMDHMDYLGNKLTGIAGEKAGIIKQGVACVVGPQEAEALEVVEREAQKKNARLLRYGHEWGIKESAEGFFYTEGKKETPFPAPCLPGHHQLANAGAAIACAHAIEKQFPMSPENLKQGLLSAHWPARMQRLTKGHLLQFLSKDSELWLDGGHNEAAGKILAAHAGKEWRDKPLYLISGMLSKKAAEDFLRPFKGLVKNLYAVPITWGPAARSPAEIKEFAEKVGLKAEVAANVEEAVRRVQESEAKPYRILICGSLYLAGTVLATNS